jgi:hypothetical protein
LAYVSENAESNRAPPQYSFSGWHIGVTFSEDFMEIGDRGKKHAKSKGKQRQHALFLIGRNKKPRRFEDLPPKVIADSIQVP